MDQMESYKARRLKANYMPALTTLQQPHGHAPRARDVIPISYFLIIYGVYGVNAVGLVAWRASAAVFAPSPSARDTGLKLIVICMVSSAFQTCDGGLATSRVLRCDQQEA
jgi:hypothetical protein